MVLLVFVLVLLAFIFEVLAAFQAKLNINTTVNFVAVGLAFYFLALLIPSLAHLR